MVMLHVLVFNVVGVQCCQVASTQFPLFSFVYVCKNDFFGSWQLQSLSLTMSFKLFQLKYLLVSEIVSFVTFQSTHVLNHTTFCGVGPSGVGVSLHCTLHDVSTPPQTSQ